MLKYKDFLLEGLMDDKLDLLPTLLKMLALISEKGRGNILLEFFMLQKLTKTKDFNETMKSYLVEEIHNGLYGLTNTPIKQKYIDVVYIISHKDLKSLIEDKVKYVSFEVDVNKLYDQSKALLSLIKGQSIDKYLNQYSKDIITIVLPAVDWFDVIENIKIDKLSKYTHILRKSYTPNTIQSIIDTYNRI